MVNGAFRFRDSWHWTGVEAKQQQALLTGFVESSDRSDILEDCLDLLLWSYGALLIMSEVDILAQITSRFSCFWIPELSPCSFASLCISSSCHKPLLFFVYGSFSNHPWLLFFPFSLLTAMTLDNCSPFTFLLHASKQRDWIAFIHIWKISSS